MLAESMLAPAGLARFGNQWVEAPHTRLHPRMEQSLADLIQRRIIDFEVGLSRSSRPAQLIGLLERAGFPVEVPSDLDEPNEPEQQLGAGLRIAGA